MNSKTPKLCIIRGLPGSSKSTTAKKLAAKYGCKHFENDEYLMHGDKYVWTPEAAKKAANDCFDDAMKALRNNEYVIVSNVFVSARVIDKYVNAAKELGADILVYRMTKNFGNIHDVSSKILAMMKASFQDYPGEILVN